ncbi:MAG TPA: hypothetical protein VHQ22_23010 [Terriglobales bacterium]|nr:hypothetical protein [Terriglobales bacterium]
MKSDHNFRLMSLILAVILLASGWGLAQTCITSDEMDAATRSAIQSAATRYFDMVSRGDSASLKQNAIPALTNNFAGMEATIKENQSNLSGAHATPRSPFELKAEGTAPLARAEFLCGVFGAAGQTANSTEFVIPNLPPGTYGVSILDVTAPKSPYTVSFVLQQIGTDWKLGGLFLRPAQLGGHDSKWFLDHANTYKSKGQVHNAWLYYLEGRELALSVPFMETQAIDKLYEEEASMKPSDVPTGGNTADLVAPDGKTYKLITFSPLPVGDNLDLLVRYQTASVADTGQAFQENMAVMKALVQKYPEVRDAFEGVVARGVESSGRDYGTMMPMKDIK